jgi:hypothetical protein
MAENRNMTERAGEELQAASKAKSALLGQMAALANFMYADGRDAYRVLPDRTRDELRLLFEALNDELQELIAQSHFELSRDCTVEDSSREANERNRR